MQQPSAFGPRGVDNNFCILSNSTLYELLNDMDVVQRINVVRMKEDSAARRVFAKVEEDFALKGPNQGNSVIDWCSQGEWKDVFRQVEIC